MNWASINWRTQTDPARTVPGFTARIAHWLDLDIAQASDGTWLCRAGGKHVASGLATPEQAKDAAWTEARKMLGDAIAEMDRAAKQEQKPVAA